MWEDRVIAEVLLKHSLYQSQCKLGDALGAIIHELGLPRSLKEYGIDRDQLQRIATNSLEDGMCRTNPIPITSVEQVMAILEKCW